MKNSGNNRTTLKPLRTRIGDLKADGYVLSEQHLRLVCGGQMKVSPTQRATYTDNQCKTDADLGE
jgi:hypothetical protein